MTITSWGGARRGLLGAGLVLAALGALALLAQPAAADTVVCGGINTATTWTTAGSPYWITCSSTVNQPLTIQPGVVVKFQPSTRLTVGSTWNNGQLTAVGTASQPIVFTANTTSPTRGFWDTIFVSGQATARVRLENATIEYGGRLNLGNVYLEKPADIVNSVVRQSSNYGVRIPTAEGGASAIRGTTFADNAVTGLLISCCSARPSVTGNTFSNNNLPVDTWAGNAGDLSGNSYAGNTIQAVRVNGATIYGPHTWRDTAVPFDLVGSTNLGDIWTPGHLTLAAGTQLRMNQFVRITAVTGTFTTLGTAAQPVLLTSNQAVKTRGFWDMLHLSGGTGHRLENTTIEYGGSSSNGLLLADRGFTMLQSTFQQSSNHGIVIRGTGEAVTIRDTTFRDSTGTGLWVQCCSNRPSVQGSTFQGNNRPIHSYPGGLGSIAGNSYPANTNNAILVDGGTLYGAHRWGEGVPYNLQGGMNLGDIWTPGQLTLAAGTQLRMNQFVRITSVNGAFQALGTAAQPIVLTSNQAVKTRGFWDMLHLSGGTGHRLENTTIEYGGSSSNGLLLADRGLTMLQGTLQQSSNHGIVIRGTGEAVTIRETTFRSNAVSGLWVQCCSNRPSVQGGTFEANGRPVHSYTNGLGGIAGNSYLANTNNAILVDGGTLYGPSAWTEKVPYDLGSGINLGDPWTRGELTLPAGAVVRLSASARLTVSNGFLAADGTAAQPVVFTSSQAVKTRGSWDMLHLSGGGARLTGALVEYGGSSGNGLILADRTLTLTDSVLRQSSNHGVIVRTGEAVTLRGSALRDNAATGLWIQCCGGQVSATGNAFERNARPVETWPGAVPGLRGNSYAGNAAGIVVSGGGSIGGAGTWAETGTTYDVTASFAYTSNANTTFAPGITLRLGPGVRITVGDWLGAARLSVAGAPGSPVTFTRLGATAWDTFYINSNAAPGAFRGAVLEGGGSSGNGMLTVAGSGHTVEGNTLRAAASYAMRLYAGGNTVRGNTVVANPIGLRADAGGNAIYDNFFNNTVNAESPAANAWNIAKSPGRNIRAGPFLGGNVWSDYCGTDFDNDGLGDTNLPYTSKGRITSGGDFAPLIRAPFLLMQVGPQLANLNQSVVYDGSATYDPEGRPIVFARWSFGDGAQADGLVASHAYVHTDRYTAALNVSADLCAFAEQRVPVDVTDVLKVFLRLDKDALLPTEQVRGVVDVRYQNLDPVPAPSVHMLLAYNLTNDADLDTILTLVNDSPTTIEWSATGGQDGAYAFEAPYFLLEGPWPKYLPDGSLNPVPPLGLANAPGRYMLYAHPLWKGNWGETVVAFQVGVPLPAPPALPVAAPAPEPSGASVPELPEAARLMETPAAADAVRVELSY